MRATDPNGPRRYFARWHYARRTVPVALLPDLARARATCRLLRAAGVRASTARAAGDDGVLVTVPPLHRAAAQRLLLPPEQDRAAAHKR